MKRLAILALVLFPSVARAQDLKDRFNIRLSLSGMYATEQQSAFPMGPMGTNEAQVMSPYALAWGELRAVIDGRRLPGSFDLHIDARARITGTWNTNEAGLVGAGGYANRGYLGGNEYDVRQAWVRRRGEKWDFGLGRMVVAEADALKLDGLRIWYRVAKHWDLSLYAGGYPNPFSRSILTDYIAGPPGSGGTGAFGFAGGLDTTYTYDKIWGAVSVNSSYLGGKNDGGPLDANALAKGPVPGNVSTETPRTWITWTDYVRLVSWLDVFTDLVLDVSGAGGVQLTRLDALATARAGKHLTLHAGYDHLSSFAIEMWLTRLLADRMMHIAGSIENNLIVERTGRDEVRGDAELGFGTFSIYADGRWRRRAIINLGDDPQFTNMGQQLAPGTAWDATFGLRDRGGLWGLRPGLWAMYLSDYRAQDLILGVTLGRSFWDERLTIDLSFLYASVTDSQVGATFAQCNTLLPVAQQQGKPNNCYGRRGGADYEFGVTVTTSPWKHWFAFFDYRLMDDTSSGYIVEPTAGMALPQPTVLTHVLLVRIEARY
jgi:hypothetical protein